MLLPFLPAQKRTISRPASVTPRRNRNFANHLASDTACRLIVTNQTHFY